MGYTIIDNFLDYQDFLQIKQIFEDTNVPWYRSMRNYDYAEGGDNFQLVHTLYYRHQPSHSGFKYIENILKKINPLSIYRIKINLLPKSSKKDNAYFHIDLPNLVNAGVQYSIGIFYLNTNDGYTILENGTKIESIENRMVFLSGNTRHSGVASTDTNRMLINFNFLNSETASLYDSK